MYIGGRNTVLLHEGLDQPESGWRLRGVGRIVGGGWGGCNLLQRPGATDRLATHR